MPTNTTAIHYTVNSTEQALAILAVDNIRPSQEGIALMQAMDRGEMTYREAVESVLLAVRKDNDLR